MGDQARPNQPAPANNGPRPSLVVRHRRPLLLRALLAFVALPGLFGFAVPLLIAALTDQLRLSRPLGIVLLLAGTSALLWCVSAFYVSGRGTLAPWAPPTRLVTIGLYRYSRNPMYLSVLLVIAGWAVTFSSMRLAIYALLVAVAFHLRVVLGEEPWLARVHGAEWRAYAKTVPRWFGRSGTRPPGTT